MPFEVADDGLDVQPGIFRRDAGTGFGQHVGINVYWNEAAQRSATLQRIEQEPRLIRCATAKLNERFGSRA